MGLRDRILEFIARLYMPATDHPARGGMTGDTETPEEDPLLRDGEEHEDREGHETRSTPPENED